jgi:peptidoglycan hydrolase CwlO-like protein
MSIIQIQNEINNAYVQISNIRKSIVDEEKIIASLKDQKEEIENNKNKLEHVLNEAIMFKQASIHNRLNHVLPKTSDCIIFIIKLLCILGIHFIFSLSPIITLIFAVYVIKTYPRDMIKKWKTLENADIKGISIKVNWLDGKIFEKDRDIYLSNCNIENYDFEIKKLEIDIKKDQELLTYSYNGIFSMTNVDWSKINNLSINDVIKSIDDSGNIKVYKQ